MDIWNAIFFTYKIWDKFQKDVTFCLNFQGWFCSGGNALFISFIVVVVGEIPKLLLERVLSLQPHHVPLTPTKKKKLLKSPFSTIAITSKQTKFFFFFWGFWNSESARARDEIRRKLKSDWTWRAAAQVMRNEANQNFLSFSKCFTSISQNPKNPKVWYRVRETLLPLVPHPGNPFCLLRHILTWHDFLGHVA